MPSVDGSGSSFGEAFRDAVSKVSLGAPRASYDRTTTLGQFRQLFATDRGYKAMGDAGLDVKQARTIQGWLDGTSTPSKKNAAAISRAYESMKRGGVPSWVKKGQMDIKGRVANGNDVRPRGSDGNAPLRVDLSQGTDEHWDDLDGEGLVDDDLPSSGGWGFPGGSYTVTISG